MADDCRVYLDQLNSDSHDYKVKVKVMRKWKPQRSASNVLYQTVLLQDDKGNKMKGTLFGDQIAGHEEALVYNGVYEIANAPIRPTQLQYRRDPTEVAYTIGFGGKTLIRPLSSAPGPFLSDYQCVSQIPKTATPYDIFGQLRKEKLHVRLLQNKAVGTLLGRFSSPIIGTFPVVAFTALRVTTHRGFSLTTTMSTSITTSPTGDKVVALTKWKTQNKESLSELQARIRRVRDPNALIHVVTLNALKSKKARSTLRDERYRLKVTVENASLQKVNAYLGCSNCGKRSVYLAGESFRCETCTKEGVVSEPRATIWRLRALRLCYRMNHSQ
ncbi:uncharacterized protein LOC141623219 isoform X3 [Silene latifolia]|uniref:uncharacterized protein LOC141623219 isoform X3 n=1 Tax=Silene latifolia TaxID=37657 RepID=UPI003D777104